MNDMLQVSDSSPVVLCHARINAFDGERFGVVSTGHRYWLKPAFGCLLQPAIGDTVLISVAGDNGYILTVLERTQPQASELRVSGNMQLCVPDGALSIETRDGTVLDAGSLLAIKTDKLVGTVTDAALALQALNIQGEHCNSQWIEHNQSAVRHQQQAIRHHAEYGDSIRRVERHEDLSAGSVRQRVKKDWSLRGETLDLFADVTVALDGERIKLG